jgi:hypothetical protein
VLALKGRFDASDRPAKLGLRRHQAMQAGRIAG